MNGLTDTGGERLEERRRRLHYRAWRRGTREMDLVLGRYADAHIGSFDSAGLDRFEALCELSDTDLWDWVSRASEAPAGVDAQLIQDLRRFQESHEDD